MKEIKDLGFGIIQVNEPKPTMSKTESVDNYLCKWEKLKEWLNHEYKEELKVSRFRPNWVAPEYKHILDKMQELEAEDEIKHR